MAWFRREHARAFEHPSQESRVPEGLWVKCENCKEILYRKDVVKNLSVCPKCAFHFRISARERLELLFDGPWEEFDAAWSAPIPLRFRDTQALRRPARRTARPRPTPTTRWSRRSGPMGGRRRDRGDGVRLHRRLDGRRGGREGHARDRAARIAASAAARRRLVLGRRAHDGGHALAHADGQDLGRARAPATRRGCRS